MLLGTMPSEVISTRYGLTELYRLSLSVKSGNVALFDEVCGGMCMVCVYGVYRCMFVLCEDMWRVYVWCIDVV